MKSLVKRAMFKALWNDGIRRLRINAEAGHIDEQAIAELWLAWDNPQWSATLEMLSTAAGLAAKSNQDTIVECGSGISTIILAVAAKSTGSRLISLESDRKWYERMSRLVGALGIPNAEVRWAPLVEHHNADWYDPQVLDDVTRIELFLCDGPPGDTRGGRSGCLEGIGPRLAPDARVLIDDTNRAPERDLAERFASLMHSHCTFWGRPDHQFALIEGNVVPDGKNADGG